MAQDRIAIEGIGKRKTFSHGVYVTILLGILALATLYLTSLYNSLLYQTVIELFSVIVACAIFIVAWNSRSLLNNNYLLFVGIAYLFVAGLDGIHIISYTGTGLSPGYSNDLSIQLWIAARYIQSLSFLIAPLLLRRRLNISTVIVTYTIVSILLLVSIFLWGIFPTCFIEGTGVTLFKTVSDYVIALIFVSALILLDRNRQRFDKGTPTLLAASIGITIASELTLALNANAYAFPNFIGYMLKAVSFYLIYRAFIETGLTRPYVLLFSNLKQSEENMVKQSQELVQANTRLELEIAERKQVAEQLRTYQEHLEDLVTQRTAELSTSNMELQLEIAERKQAEEILDRVNRALKTLSECNQAMARATEESELLEEVCRALVRVGGYLLAWVGFAETDEAKTVRPVAHAGYEDGYLDTVDITWADTERGLGPVGTAIRTGQTCITRNIADDINFSIWRAEATKRGYASVITLPLFINGQILGSLNIYASEPDAFDADEVKQLTELADDLSFGITALRTRAEQKRAEEELRLKAQMLDAATDSIMLYDPTDGSFIYVNEAAYKSRGYTRDEVMRMKRQDLTAPQARRLSKGRHLKEVLEKGHLFFESIHQHKDGTTIPVEANVHVIETGGHKLVLSVTRDITERKQAEETLRESEEKYRKLVEGMQEGIWVIDKDACTTFVNPRMAEMLGYTVEEMQGKHLFYFMDEHDVELAKYQLERRKQGITEQHDFEFLRKDGARIYTSIETSPITDEKGNYMGALACVADITKRRQAEEQLKESEEKYSTLIERSNDGILIIKDGLVEFANTRMVDMVGYFLDEVLGKPFLEFVAPEHVELVLERYKKRMSGEDIPNNYEIDILTKDGRKIPVEINASRIEYQGGFADMAMVRDITERRKAETAVRESEEKYSTIVEKSNDGIIIIQDGILKFTNSRMIEMTGFSPDEALGKSFIEFVPPEHAGMLIDRYTRRRSGEKVPDNYETEILTRDGMKILVEVNVSQIEYKGKLVDIAIIRDITERKRAQEELKRSEERYRFLAENARDVIYRVSFVPAPHFEYVSPSVTAQLGYTPEECYADPDIWSKLIHPAYRTTMSEFGKSPALPKGAVITRWMRKDGTSIWAENSSTLFYDENGKVIAMQGISRDVTERVQAEQLYRTLASSSPVGVYIIQDNKFIFTNPKIQKDTGYTEEELLSKDTLSIIHPDDRESAGKNAIDILKGRRLQPYEYRYITKTGEARWALENVVSINYGGRQAVLGTPMDITERKQAQELYTTLANSSPVGIYIALDDRFVFANAMMQKNTGYTEEELLGKETLSIIHPEDKKSARENAIEMLKGKRTQPYEFRYLTKTGETRWALGRMTSVTYQGRQAILGVSINITEYKQAELLYHNLADSSPVGVYIYQDNKFIFTNPAFKKATGYTDDDLMGKDAPWIVHLEDRTSVDRNSIDMLKGKRLQPYEFRYITKSGETRWALERVSSITYDGKRATLGNFMDITERKQAEQLYHNLADSSSVGVYIVQDKKFVFTNPAFHEATGYTNDALLGRDPSIIIHPEDRESVRQNAVQMLKGKRLQPYEFRFITKSGETRWALERASSITYDGKRATLGNFLDMTELKQAMSALQESEEKLRLMFQAVTDGIVITDMNGGILDVNERVLKMFGLQSRDDVIGKSALEFIAPRHRDLARKNFLSTREQGATKEIEYTLLKADGYEFPGEASGSLLKDATGKPLGFITVIRDVTERRRMEEQLILTDRLASIGELAAGIAHELNNPLTGVIGLSQLLLEKTTPADIQDDLKIICSEAQRASQVVKNLLMFARKHSVVKAPVDVTEVLDKVLVLRAYEQRVNNIEAIRRFTPDLPKVQADYFQLQQVFLNIIINAEYFMTEAHHRGKLIISAERINDFVRISFADDGPGIAKENITHLFDPFFTTKEVGKGTGLGLSICHGIVISHGGKIYAQSEFGKGATFTIELPLTERQEEREAIE